MSALNAQTIFNEILPSRLRDDGRVKSVSAIYQFNIEGVNGGTWTVDLTTDPNVVREGNDDAAHCTISLNEADFIKLWSGKLDGMQAYILGKLKIRGDITLAMKVRTFLGS